MKLKTKAKILSGLFSIICALGYFAPNTIKAVEHPTVDPTEKTTASADNAEESISYAAVSTDDTEESTDDTTTDTTSSTVEQFDCFQFSRLCTVAQHNPPFAKELQTRIKNGTIILQVDLSPYADATLKEDLYYLLVAVHNFCMLAQDSSPMKASMEYIQNQNIPTSTRIDELPSKPIPLNCVF